MEPEWPAVDDIAEYRLPSEGGGRGKKARVQRKRKRGEKGEAGKEMEKPAKKETTGGDKEGTAASAPSPTAHLGLALQLSRSPPPDHGSNILIGGGGY